MVWTRKSTGAGTRSFQSRRPSEHWYRDNQVYFITARCRGRFPAFSSEQAKGVFWTQFDACAGENGFVPWVTTLVDNHYHTIGYLRHGEGLAPMMRRLHGSVAKLVNDVLEAEVKTGGLKSPCLNDQGRLLPFWSDAKHKNYFDGCLRDEKQGRLTYRYVFTQSKRHGVYPDWRNYPHTHVNVELDRAIRRALELNAFLEGVRYKRYEQDRGT